MKYIKTFEALSIKDLKKYLIIQSDQNHDILSIHEKHMPSQYSKVGSDIYLKELYNYYLKEYIHTDGNYRSLPNKLYSINRNFKSYRPEHFDDFIRDNILYMSDELQDCINIIPYISNINKFNI
jgi:hypothetical protein